jgi:hypothetical protein
VASLLDGAASGLGKYLRIVGLGVPGDIFPLSPGENPDEAYRQYRTVDLVIKVYMEKYIQQSGRLGLDSAWEGAPLP